MKLIAGLGNPGKDYEKTRHNAGFMFVDFMVEKFDLKFNSKFQAEYSEINKDGEKIIFLKPQTFMNDSGVSLAEAVKFYKINSEEIFIAFDDLDLPEGEFKIQKGKYPKVHNGVNDIIEKLGTDNLNFIRIGIDGRAPELRKVISGRDYVLQKTSYNYKELFSQIYETLKL
jgi:PTH1 family peptidyl-tRNA hydrolase